MRSLRFALLALLTLSASAQSLDDRVQREIPTLLDTYKAIHAMPELSTQEVKTSAYVAKRLRELGYEVTEKVGKYKEPDTTCYGVVAIMRNGTGPTVMVRSDMDALPVAEQTGLPYASQNAGVMHACGHDVHMTKADIIRRGLELGVDYGLTHSCYDPAPDGRACGHCDSCLLRRKGFEEAGVEDPTEYAESQSHRVSESQR